MSLDEQGVEDAAILLMSLGEEDAAEVFRHLAPKEVQRLGETMAKLNSLSESRGALADRVTKADIRSPVRGTVKRLLVNTVGGVAFDITSAQIDADGVLAVGVLVEIEFTVAADGFYRLELAAPDGRLVEASPRYTIDALEDQPPEVRVTKPGRDGNASPIEEVYFEARPGRRVQLGISVGAAVFPHDGDTYEALLATAPSQKLPVQGGKQPGLGLGDFPQLMSALGRELTFGGPQWTSALEHDLSLRLQSMRTAPRPADSAPRVSSRRSPHPADEATTPMVRRLQRYLCLRKPDSGRA